MFVCSFVCFCCLKRTPTMVCPSGWGGGEGVSTAIYGLYRYVPLWRVWFSSCLFWDRVYKLESLGREEGIIFQETDQLVGDFSLDQGNRELPLKNMRKKIKSATLNLRNYRLRVPGSRRHIPHPKVLKYPPPPTGGYVRSCGVDEIFKKEIFLFAILIWTLNLNIIALSIDLVFHFSLIRQFRWCHSWMRHLTRFWRRCIEFLRQERLLISTGIAK